MSTPQQTTRGYGFPQSPPGPETGPGPDRGGRVRQRARWGLAGALLASAVWTAAVWTVPSLVATASSPLRLGGYRTPDDLCGSVRFVQFDRLYPVPSGAPYHYTTRSPALDDSYCGQSLKRVAADTGSVSLAMEVQLHRAVSAAPEFDAQRSGLEQRKFQVSDVAGLGERAFAAYLDDHSGSDPTRHYLTQALYVRDGGLTCYLTWSGSYQAGQESPPDRESIRQALVIDTRDALRALGGR